MRLVAAPAAALERLDRRLPTARMGNGDEVVGHPDDPQRAGDLLPGHVSRHALAVPARRHLGERAGDLVGQVEAPGEQPSALAEVRRRQLELLLASDQLLGDEAGALRQRPVVREMPDEVPHVLGRFGGRAEDLHAALKWISSPPTQLAK
jgi:hypothetical protein